MRRTSRGTAVGAVLVFLAAMLALGISGDAGAADPATTVNLSVRQNGNPVQGWSSLISPDGRYVAFASVKDSVVSGDSNGTTDAFIRDRVTGEVKIVSRPASGVQATWASRPIALSDNGEKVLFISYDSTFVPGDTNGTFDLFVWHRADGAIERVSTGPGGQQASVPVTVGSISDDGRFVVFQAADPAWPGGSPHADIWLRDLATGQVTKITKAPDGSPLDGPSENPTLSADGRFVAFESTASNLLPGGGLNATDVFVVDRLAGTTERVSVGMGGVPAAGDSFHPVLSADGRFVAFDSDAGNLAPNDFNNLLDVFVRDRASGAVTLASMALDGTSGGGDSSVPTISADGRHVAFSSDAEDLVADDDNAEFDVFVRDLATGVLDRASLRANGKQVDGPSEDPFDDDGPRISGDGRYIAFDSPASDLKPAAAEPESTFSYLRDRGTLPTASWPTPASWPPATTTSTTSTTSTSTTSTSTTSTTSTSTTSTSTTSTSTTSTSTTSTSTTSTSTTSTSTTSTSTTSTSTSTTSTTAGPTPPVMTLSTTSVSFGGLNLGSSANRQVRVRNTGGSPLQITTSAPPTKPDFTPLTTLPVGTVINPGAFVDLSVRFTANQTGLSSDTWTLAANDGLGTRQVSLQGTGSPTIPSGVPIGAVDSATPGPRSVAVAGWSIDPDSTGAVSMHVYVDGKWGGSTVADASRPDVGAAYPGYGSAHGWQRTITGLSPGRHDVCVYAINVGPGLTNPLIQCRSVTVQSGNPFGSIDSVHTGPRAVTVSGWAIDPDTTGPVSMHFYVDGRWGGSMTASASRSDVGYVYPGYGSAHGFRHTISGLSAGAHTVCVYAINIGAGTTNPSFGCRSVTVLGGNPFGSLDGVNPSSGSVLVSGWAIDPDTTAPIDVHIYVDGVWRGSTVAALSRPDVGRVYPGYGSAHGWQRTVSVGKGAHTVQVYAINVGPGSTNPLIGSRTFVVP